MTHSIAGNVTANPELRFTVNGMPTLRITIASQDRWFTGDGEPHTETSFFDCVLFGDLAENAAESVRKGDRVLAIGKFRQRKWVDEDGYAVEKIEFMADEFGPSLKWGNAEVTRIKPERHLRAVPNE